MRILFYIGHPAHYHNISHVAPMLEKEGHQILLAARNKDVVLDLLENVRLKKVIVAHTEGGEGKISKAWAIFKREFAMLKVILSFRPQLMAGTDIVITHLGKLFGIPSVIINEDDAPEVPLFAKLGMKYATCMLSPLSCNVHPYENKNITYPGYQELAYLHPNYFKPDREKIKQLFNNCERYFIIRFAKLTAHHDAGKTGITKQLAHEMINILSPQGKVYITSERELEPEFEQYRIKIHPCDMHHAMYFADLYIGDSQTMAAEAAVLGTPSIRFNDFVGRLGYLEELEHKYGLTFGIKTNEPEKLLGKVKELSLLTGLKNEWQKRKQFMLENSVDVARLWVWFFANYPQSANDLKSNPEKIQQFI